MEEQSEQLKEIFKKIERLFEENARYKIGHDRYEKIRRLSPMQFHQLYEKNLQTGEHFDILVDKL